MQCLMVWNEHRMNTDEQELKEVIDVWHISTQAKMRPPKINAGKTALDTRRQSARWFGKTVKYTYFSLRTEISCIDLSQRRSSTTTSGIWTSAAEISMKKRHPGQKMRMSILLPQWQASVFWGMCQLSVTVCQFDRHWAVLFVGSLFIPAALFLSRPAVRQNRDWSSRLLFRVNNT